MKRLLVGCLLLGLSACATGGEEAPLPQFVDAKTVDAPLPVDAKIPDAPVVPDAPPPPPDGPVLPDAPGGGTEGSFCAANTECNAGLCCVGAGLAGAGICFPGSVILDICVPIEL